MNKTLAEIKWLIKIVILIFVFTVAFLSAITFSAANTNSLMELKGDYRFIRDAGAGVLSNENKQEVRLREISPLGFTANGLLTIYQTLVSSQDNKVCNFSPSCSHFAREAINRAGFIKGSLMASDRLLRCHPYSLGQYRVDIKSGKSIDPVGDYLGRR